MPNVVKKLQDAIKSDPRKAGILAVLAVVMLVMWGRLALTGKSAPKGASASAVGKREAASTASKKKTDRFSPSASSAQASSSLHEWLRGSIAPLQRNLFSVNLDYFPSDSTKINRTLRQPDGDGFWDQLAKSMTAQADQKKERQILIENLQLQAAQLRLQSTMMGPVPKALLNEQFVKVGDVIAKFRIVKIEARRIVVEREGVKLEIVMK